jgi:high-affinity Fe2+/Pb2+ permease
MPRAAFLSALLFIAGLFAFATGSAVLLGGGSLCAGAAATSFARALSAPCGGMSRVGGVIILVVAAVMLWGSNRLQRATRDR